MRRRAALAVSCALLLASLPAACQAPLTLPEVLRLVEERSLEADLAKLEGASAREDTSQAQSLYYPQFTLDFSHVNLDHAPYFIAGPIVFPSGEASFWQYRLAARYVIWDGGRRSAALEGRRTAERAVSLAGGEAVRKAQAEAVARYVALLALKAQAGVVEQRRRALDDHLRTVKDLFENGVVARNDLLRTEVALRSVDDQASSLRSACASALESLNQSLGLDPGTPQVLPEALPPPPPLPWDEASCRSRAAEGNGSVRALSEKVQALEERLRLSRKDYWPRLVAEYAHSYTQNEFLLYPYVHSLFLGVSVDLFDGGVKDSRVRQARIEVERAQRELLEARRGAEVAAAQAMRDFREALKETETARANVDASVENLRILEDQYREGLARTTDVLDAESVLAESRFALAQKHYQAYARQSALIAAMGEDLRRFYGAIGGRTASREN